MKRDTTLSILKGIGIILVVMGHCGCPFNKFIYSFHMPLFFIASGYFFSEKNLDDKLNYCKRKVKGVYLPFLKWSLIFLFLHNVFFHFGILNNLYGNYSGFHSRLYSLKTFEDILPCIIFKMSKYESFLLGAYWFMRPLFLGAIVICISSWAINKLVNDKAKSIAIIGVVFCAFSGYMTYTRTFFSFFPQGGYREILAIFFMVCGFMFHKCTLYLENIWIFLAALIIYLVGSELHPTAMSINAKFADWYTILFTGTCGFIATYFISKKISVANNYGSKFLVYCGDHSLYIMTFHFLMFKPAMLLRTYIYGLDWHMIGYHPVIPSDDHWYWIIYTISSLLFSLGLASLCKKVHL